METGATLRYSVKPWLMWLSGVGIVPQTERSPVWKVTGSIPSQGTCLGGRPGPQFGVCKTNRCFSPTLMFPSLSPSSPLSLKINKIFFKKIQYQDVNKIQNWILGLWLHKNMNRHGKALESNTTEIISLLRWVNTGHLLPICKFSVSLPLLQFKKE